MMIVAPGWFKPTGSLIVFFEQPTAIRPMVAAKIKLIFLILDINYWLISRKKPAG
jgi:hypothetical protein